MVVALTKYPAHSTHVISGLTSLMIGRFPLWASDVVVSFNGSHGLTTLAEWAPVVAPLNATSQSIVGGKGCSVLVDSLQQKASDVQLRDRKIAPPVE